MQQVESSLQQWAEASVLSEGLTKARQQRTAIEHPAVRIASSLAQVLRHLRGHPKPAMHRQAHRGRGMRGRILRTTHATLIVVGAMIERGATLAPRG
jgi:late competence protein required for DNA uptake (superfamily II DNA/RNA helicase)